MNFIVIKFPKRETCISIRKAEGKEERRIRLYGTPSGFCNENHVKSCKIKYKKKNHTRNVRK